MNINIQLKPRRVLSALLLLISFLFLMNLFAGWMLYVWQPSFPGDASIIDFFYMDYEINLPTWVASKLLFVNAALLLLIAIVYKQNDLGLWKQWGLLSVTFLYLSIDEATLLHEKFKLVPDGQNLTLPFDIALPSYFTWVFPAIVLLAILGVMLLPFLRKISPTLRKRFFIAGAIYVGGAIGFEFIGGQIWETIGDSSMIYVFVMGIEESMEKLGLALFLFALLDHLPDILSQATISAAQTKPVWDATSPAKSPESAPALARESDQ